MGGILVCTKLEGRWVIKLVTFILISFDPHSIPSLRG